MINQIANPQTPEPAIPKGYKAGEWFRWASQIQQVARMLGLTKNWSVGENFAIRAMLQKGEHEGYVQHWKPYGDHQSSPSYFRLIWKDEEE